MKKVLFLVLMLTAACTDIEIQRGAELKQEKIDRITKESSKGDVVNLLGSPSATSKYGDESWYYIYNRREQNLLTDDKVIEQNVLAIVFGADDKVKNVEIYDKSKAQDIKYSSNKTKTAGHELGMLEQLLGNVGKFNKDGEGRSATRGHVPGR